MRHFLISKAYYMLVSGLVLMGTTTNGFSSLVCDELWYACMHEDCSKFKRPKAKDLCENAKVQRAYSNCKSAIYQEKGCM